MKASNYDLAADVLETEYGRGSLLHNMQACQHELETNPRNVPPAIEHAFHTLLNGIRPLFEEKV